MSYTLGFLNAFLFVRRKRAQLGLSMTSVYNLNLLLVIGVLLGGRFVEVVFYEWPFYSQNPQMIPAYWLGGMATHGLLFGGLVGIWLFSRIEQRSFLCVTDALVIPAAVIMGLGRIGNFIDGQIVGSVTTVWWAVKFPDAEGFRHPVVLYDGLKNLLIVPVLIYLEKGQLPHGVQTGVFLFLYAFLRIFVDVFREYPTTLLGLATGQVLNILLSLFGLGLILVLLWKRSASVKAAVANRTVTQKSAALNSLQWRPWLFTAILLLSTTMPSDSTQDIPARYGRRHPGLHYSTLYPHIAETEISK